MCLEALLVYIYIEMGMQRLASAKDSTVQCTTPTNQYGRSSKWVSKRISNDGRAQ